MRYLSIDLGTKRTGLAVGDDITRIVTPAGTSETSNPAQCVHLLKQAISEHQPDALVVGLPLNMDGTEGQPAKDARKRSKQLHGQTGLIVHLMDERSTSESANQMMSRSGLTHRAKKARRDSLAASAILSRFLEYQSSP